MGAALGTSVGFGVPVGSGLAVLVAVGSGLAVLVAVRPFARKIGVFALLTLVLFGWWWTVTPRNDRNWSADVARLSRGEDGGDWTSLAPDPAGVEAPEDAS